MKKQISISLILLSYAIASNAQIYTPSQKLQGSSSNNNVVIGMENPNDAKLQIKGDYNLRIDPSGGSIPFFYITTNSSDNIIGTNIRTKLGTWNVPDKNLPSAYIDFSTYSNNNPAYGGMQFLTREAGSQSELGTARMTLLNNGYLGIGTISPKYELDVKGIIRAQEIKVDLDGADFVFENNYNLMPLLELERFIKAKKHLPEVATANEMKENGTDLGNLNSKLLQKVEELTLYTIEQEKAIEELKAMMSLQNEKIKNLQTKSE